LKALIDINLPKFISNDMQLFKNIISDLFPGIKLENNVNQQFDEMLLHCIKELNLRSDNEFVDKLYQLNNTMIVRHGIMIIGPTGSGKTTN